MSFKLRDYQENDIKRLRKVLSEKDSVIYNLPTGGGKTASTSYMLNKLSRQNRRGWFICHRKELLEQASAAFNKQNIKHGLIGNNYKFDPEKRIQVCNVLSLLNKIDKLPHPDFVIWDECHHIAAKSWKKIFNKVKGAKHLGLSATPIRLDGRALDTYFKDIICGPSLKELILQGYLCQYRLYAPSAPDLENIGAIKKDFNKEQLNSIVRSSFVFGDIWKHWRQYAPNKKTVIFCSSIEHSEQVANKFRKEGVIAEHVEGGMSLGKRTEIISNFENGKTKVLVNVDLISEGFDLPAIECIILLRPTMSLSLYLQQIGRALRIYKNKKEAIILDHAGNSLRHGLPDESRNWDLGGRLIVEDTKSSTLRVCINCHAVFNYNIKKCECGHEAQIKQREITYIDGSLVHVNKDRSHRNATALTEKQVVKIIDLYFNKGWPISDILKDLSTEENCIVNRTFTISPVVNNKTWKYITRPNITHEELRLRQAKYRFDKSYVINESNKCWEWTKYSPDGVPYLSCMGKNINARKFIYQYHNGTLPKNYVAHASCFNGKCVNPTHLEIITHSQSVKMRKKVDIQIMRANAKRMREIVCNSPELKKKRYETKSKTMEIYLYKDNEILSFSSPIKAAEYLNISKVMLYRVLRTGRKTKGYEVKNKDLF